MLRGVLRMIALLLVCASPTAAGEAVDPPSTSHFQRGSIHAGLAVGYGIGFRFGSKADRKLSRELAGVRLIEFLPRIGLGVTNPLGVGAWYSGNVVLLVEGGFFHNTAQNHGVGGGIGSTLRYNFLFADRIVPFLDANFGVLGMNLDLNRQSDGFNFNVGFGGGVHWFVSHRVAISTELRWQHISNMGTKHPNDGINNALVVVGASYFFP
jgi:opacity protein-like surface antigen